jgi:NADPH:quinone reductase-like Zn-dependent oxidoreductase
MNEQTFVPVSMRALYYSEVPVSNPPEEEAATEDASVKSIMSPKTKASNPELIPIVTLDTEFPTPQPAPHQYLLKVQTAAFCQDELRLANALNPHPTTPEIPLHSICGTVISTPTKDHEKPEGPKFKIGDQVFGVLSYTRDGGAADYTIATEDELALKPKNICTGEAAALALPALTAWQALFRYGGVDPDAAPNTNGHEKNGNGHAEKPEPWNAPANGNTKANRRSSIRNSIAHISEHLNKRGFSNASGSSGPQRLRKSISHLNTQIQGRFIGNRNGKGHASTAHGLGEQRSMSMNEQESTSGSRRGSRNSLFPTRKVRPLRALITNARDSEVGRLAVQMLRARKLFTADRPWVCVTCSPAEERIVRGGWDVDGVIVIPHLPAENECAIGAEFRRMRWDPVDLVLDCTGGEVFRQAHFVVKDYGAVLTVVDPRPALEPENADEQDVLGRRKRGLRSMFVPVNPDAKALWRIVELVEEQMVRGREEQVVDLVDAAKLLEAGAAGVSGSRRGGMVVVRVNP